MADNHELDELLGRVGAELDRQLRTPAPLPARQRDQPRRPLVLATAAALVAAVGVVGVWQVSQRSPQHDDAAGAPVQVPADAAAVIEHPARSTVLPIVTTVLGGPAPDTLPPSEPASSCGTYVVQRDDSLANIARDHLVSIDALLAINGFTNGGEVVLMPEQALTLPCPEWLTRDDVSDDVECVPATTPRIGMPYVVFDPVPIGYAPMSSTRGSFGKDADPPAALFVWDDGETVTPFGIAHDTDGSIKTLAMLGAIPAWLISEIVEAATIGETFEITGPLPEGVTLVATQEVDTFMHAAGYQGDERLLWVQTLTDYPLDTYLDPGTTIELDVYVHGATGFLLRSPSQGGGDPGRSMLFWPATDGPYVYSIGVNDEHADVDELIDLADTIRRATPAESAQFVDPNEGSSWDCS